MVRGGGCPLEERGEGWGRWGFRMGKGLTCFAWVRRFECLDERKDEDEG